MLLHTVYRAQERSLEYVAAMVWYSAAVQVVSMLHTRSDEMVGCCVEYCDELQVDTNEQPTPEPAMALKVMPAKHGMHTRLVNRVGGATSWKPGPHTDTGKQAVCP